MISRAMFKMSTLWLLAVSCAMAQTSIPGTPAGRTLQSWLEAFHNGRAPKRQGNVNTMDHTQSVDDLMSFRNSTGGFDLLAIESSEPLQIRFRVKERGSNTTALGNLVVKDGQPPTVDTFGLRALPPGATVEKVTLDAVLRQQVIDGVK